MISFINPRKSFRRAAAMLAALGASSLALPLFAAPAVTEPVTGPVAALPGPAAGPLVERRLHLSGAEASSFLWDDFSRFQQNYHPLYLGDDDPKTGWVEGIKGQGVGEWVRLKFTPMEGATQVRLMIRNGYQKTDRLYELNSRLKDVSVKLLPSGTVMQASLKDQKGFQELVITQPAGPFDGVELTVRSVYPGSKWDDLTISDLQVFVTAKSRENPAFEKARFDKLLKWKAERVAAAARFKAATKQAVPLLPQYQVDDEGPKLAEVKKPDNCQDQGGSCDMWQGLERLRRLKKGGEAELTLAQELTKKGFTDFRPVRVVAVDDRPISGIDGLCTPDLNSCINDGCYESFEMPMTGQMGFLRVEGFNSFEQPDNPSFQSVSDAEPRQCKSYSHVGKFYYAYREKNAEGREMLRALLIAYCGRVETREGFVDAHRSQLLVYDAAGRLKVVASENRAAVLEFQERSGMPVLVAGTQATLFREKADVLFAPGQVAASSQSP